MEVKTGSAFASSLPPWQRVLLACVLVATAALSVLAPNPPAALPANAPAGEFSAERAMLHVRAIAHQPHPVGSTANDQVRAYLSESLRNLGLATEEQPFQARARDRDVGGVNLLCRIPAVPAAVAPENRAIIALVAHYDSVSRGPGAADDGAGVATLLETARALKSGAPLQNELLLLFTDGEEAGLLGARAFVERAELVKDFALVLNFEARGVSGPVYMFETSTGNASLTRAFAEAAPRPVANSLMYEVYKQMPNDTDLTVFKKAGVTGLNFAFIGAPQHYHAPTDDPAHLNVNSLQHMGSYALSLTRHFGDLGSPELIELRRPADSDAVYFDLFGRVLVYYPAKLALPLTVMAFLGLVASAVRALRKETISFRKLMLAFGASLGLILAVALGFRFLPVRFENYQAAMTPNWALWFGSIAATLALSIASRLFLRRWISSSDFTFGILSIWAILSIASTILAPGASYLFTWPLIFGICGILLSRWRFASLLCSGIPAVLLVFPLVHSFYVALGNHAIAAPMVVLALLLTALSPHID